MDDAPRLNAKDVQAEVEAIYDYRKRRGEETPRHLFAFFGTGDEQTISSPAGTFDVIPVASELELRERLPALDDDERRVVFLVPFTRDVPLDIGGRFHKDGRVVRIGPEAQLRRIFGVAAVDRAVSASPLAALLLAGGTEELFPAGVASLDLATMWSAWLARKVELPTPSGAIEREALIAWAARDTRGPTFLGDVGEPRRGDVEQALLTHLRALGPDLAAVFRAWRGGRGRDALELGLLFSTLASRPEAVARMFVRDRAKDVLRVADNDEALQVASALGAAAPGALRVLDADTTESTLVKALLRAADERATAPEIRELLATDPRLPLGWAKRLEELGDALARGAAQPTADAVKRAAQALRGLESHRSFHEERRELLERAEMAVRLLAWLATRGDAQVPTAATSIGDAEALGRWYAHEGGFVDWARHRARCEGDDPLAIGVKAVVAAADDARFDLDRRFAVSLKAYFAARRQSTQVLPLERVAERLVVKFLDDKATRRLLILLIDGMGWAQAAEVLLDLEEHHVQPIAWNQTKKARVGDGANITHNTVFAALPTVTEISRSAFFLGALIAPGESGVDASRDDERFRKNKAISKFFSGSETPRLLLRGEVSSEGGLASSEAITAVRDPSARVVAVVLNAIDSSLKGDPQALVRWGADSIKPLLPLVRAAQDSGRSVLLVSDHGHVSADLFGPGTRKPDAGARWRPYKGESDTLADWEMMFDGEGVWTPRGTSSVVLITDDRHRYTTGVHAGEHGGATLAEVVVPCLLLGFDDPAPAIDPDPDLVVRTFMQPSFWRFEVPERIARDPKPATATQLPLLSTGLLAAAPAEPPPAPGKASAPEPPPLEALAVALAASAVLAATAPRAPQRDRVVRAVSFLESRGCIASEQAFAAAIGEPARKVGQIVSVLQESLNVDSFAVLVHDRTAREVRLDRELLIQQFQLPR